MGLLWIDSIDNFHAFFCIHHPRNIIRDMPKAPEQPKQGDRKGLGEQSHAAPRFKVSEPRVEKLRG